MFIVSVVFILSEQKKKLILIKKHVKLELEFKWNCNAIKKE